MNEVQNEKKVSTGMAVLITLLVVLLVGCISFIVYDKFIKKENSNPTITDKDKNNEATGENKDAEVELKSWMTYLLNSDIDNIELTRIVCPNECNEPGDWKVVTKFVTKEDLKNIFKKLNDEQLYIISNAYGKGEDDYYLNIKYKVNNKLHSFGLDNSGWMDEYYIEDGVAAATNPELFIADSELRTLLKESNPIELSKEGEGGKRFAFKRYDNSLPTIIESYFK